MAKKKPYCGMVEVSILLVDSDGDEKTCRVKVNLSEARLDDRNVCAAIALSDCLEGVGMGGRVGCLVLAQVLEYLPESFSHGQDKLIDAFVDAAEALMNHN